ncbi:L-amino acid N-acyltransferase YncA [Streptomyces sp. yr375]|uniref:GNAT family N-acetyltransferase n=1 Tax=Streptomyces sp. yr375 TaxID=1761906 RepID=UPI0008BEB8BE|nr:GNAT family N-acetyltransferase [Streptomyces sp. yr375]SEQ11401.1 L-amino acid N-acyltransferase YncA [Streptomyces sp. yr375]
MRDDERMTSLAVIRDMTLADVDRVSEIRVRGWQSAYRGLLPQSYLDALSVAEDAGRRRAGFSGSAGGAVNLVAERGGEVVGWAAHGAYRDGEVHICDAELYALYVDVGHLGTGVGRALLAESVRQAGALGRSRMYLWVLRDNLPARRFYERAGFHADGAEVPCEVAGALVTEVRYLGRVPG